MACLRDLAKGAFLGPFGLIPLCRVPRLYSRMTLVTLLCWALVIAILVTHTPLRRLLGSGFAAHVLLAGHHRTIRHLMHRLATLHLHLHFHGIYFLFPDGDTGQDCLAGLVFLLVIDRF